MNFTTHSYRHAEVILRGPEFIYESEELLGALRAITDQEIIERYATYGGRNKSVSRAINDTIKSYLTDHGWASGSPIFQDTRCTGIRWRLDLAKGVIQWK